MNPFETVPLHIIPKENLAEGGDYGVSRQWLPGMLPLQELVQLYGYPLRPEALQELHFGSDGQTKIRVGTGTGGVIQEWWPENGPQLINNAGLAGRSVNQTLFCIGPDYYANPTMAGDKFDQFFPDVVDPKIQEPPNNYRQHSLIHGARMLEMEHHESFLRTVGIPLEWDGDGTWPGMLFNHGGSVLDQREYKHMQMEFEIDWHWRGGKGLHRFKSICRFPEVAPKFNLKWGTLGLFLRFGYDDILAYNAEANQVLSLLDVALCKELNGTVTSWEDKGSYVVGNLSIPHGRATETRQSVIYLPGTDLQMKISSIFMDGPDSQRLRIDPKPTVLPDAGSIFAPAVYTAQLSDVQMRYGWSNRMQIGGGTGLYNLTDQSGSYPINFFGNVGNAVIYASRPDSTNPWSFKQDFAIAMFVPFMDKLSGAPETTSQRHLRWASKRGPDTPTNGQKHTPVMILADTNQWNAGLPKPRSPLVSTAYVCTGTLPEVMAQLEELRGMTA